MYFRCELFTKDGKILEERHVEVNVGDVNEAMKHEKIVKLKKKAYDRGLGFRVKREDN